jgi:hypothetical protein
MQVVEQGINTDVYIQPYFTLMIFWRVFGCNEINAARFSHPMAAFILT